MSRVISYALVFLLFVVIPTAGVNNEESGVCYPEKYSIEFTDNAEITSYSYEGRIIHSRKSRPITVNSTIVGFHYSGGVFKCGYETVAGYSSITLYHLSSSGGSGILTFTPKEWEYMSSSDANKSHNCHAKYFPISPKNVSIGDSVYYSTPAVQTNCPFPSNCTVIDTDAIMQVDMITRCWP